MGTVGTKMAAMRKHRALAAAALSAIAILMCLPGVAGAQDDYDGPMSDLQFVVLKDYNGKPVRNAAVVLHPVTRKGKQSRGGMELKTDSDGKTNIDGIPYGPLRIQVLAPGFQTFGEDYQIDKPALVITVRLRRPEGQYSVYDDPKPQQKPDAQKPQ